ncbi:MAG: PAS domain-containing protein [Pirellulales bacterium]|nr:PAS domain-containing protein [Pirellulales bacterium]
MEELERRLAQAARDETALRRELQELAVARLQLLSVFDSVDAPIYVADPTTYEILYANEAVKACWGDGIGRPCYQFFQGQDTPCSFCTNKEIFGEKTGQVHVWEVQNRRTGRWLRCVARAIRWPDGRMVRCEMGIDITQRKEAEELLRQAHEQLESRVDQRTAELAAANAALSREMTEREEVHKALRNSEASARALVDAVTEAALLIETTGVLSTLNETAAKRLGGTVESLTGHFVLELMPEKISKRRREKGEGVIASGKPVHFEEERDGRYYHTHIHPVFDADNHVARLAVFSQDMTETRQAADELRRRQAFLQQLLNMQERERQLTAYEIHDGLAQELTGALLRFQAFREMLSQNPDEAWPVFDVGLNLLEQAVGEARALITGLRPPILDEAGIVAAVDYLVCESREEGADDDPESGRVEIEFDHSPVVDRLDPSLETAVFRIVQEALANARRHSQSDRIRVELTQQDDRLCVQVRDWGVGFHASTVVENRFGLRGIRERARLLNGQATIESSPGQGTSVRVELPLSNPLTDPTYPVD